VAGVRSADGNFLMFADGSNRSQRDAEVEAMPAGRVLRSRCGRDAQESDRRAHTWQGTGSARTGQHSAQPAARGSAWTTSDYVGWCTTAAGGAL